VEEKGIDGVVEGHGASVLGGECGGDCIGRWGMGEDVGLWEEIGKEKVKENSTRQKVS
jgi:hypothetical protein